MSFAGRSSKDLLHSGSNFMQLADFLKPAVSQAGNSDPAFASLVVQERSDGSCEVKRYFKAEDTTELHARTSLTSSIGQLIFIRGYSNSEWLLLLRAQLRVDLEFFRRHLDFLLPKDFYDLPALLSTFTQGCSLKVVTVSNRPVALTRSQLHDLQGEEDDAVKKHQRESGAEGKNGASVVRRWLLHDEWTYTLE